MSNRIESQKNRESNEKIQLLVVMGASMEKGLDGKYSRFPLGVQTNRTTTKVWDPFRNMKVEVVGGDSRFLTVREYYKDFKEKYPQKNIQILTTGGYEENGISRAQAARERLIEKYGILENDIKALPSEASTLGNANSIVNWARQHRDKQCERSININLITGSFHAIRSWIMIAHASHYIDTGEDLGKILREKDKQDIQEILTKSLNVFDGDLNALRMIQDIYQPYIKNDSVRSDVIVVEEYLRHSKNTGIRKYAEKLLHHPLTQAARENERMGIRAFLRGDYKMR
jgi:hypothetical protein